MSDFHEPRTDSQITLHYHMLRTAEIPYIQAANAIARADAMLITAGAGISVDSGLPDFRGDEGFWQAYPALAGLGLSFSQIACPRFFVTDPTLAWAFYGHRLNLYRQTTPHPGFGLLLAAASRMRHGYFVVTSNVDGQFQKAGFDQGSISEIHGSIHHVQCAVPCTRSIWSADPLVVSVDPVAFRACPPLPVCGYCGETARPNTLLFNDNPWISARADLQDRAFRAWLESIGDRRLVILELGAGTAIPTLRAIASQVRTTLIRINPTEYHVLPGQIAIPCGALAGLARLFGGGLCDDN